MLWCVWKEIKNVDKKNILICVPKMNEGLKGLERHDWVINDRIFILEWTIPLTPNLNWAPSDSI